MFQLVKKPLKLNKKIKKKTEDSIDEKRPKLDKKIRTKTDHLFFYRDFFIRNAKPSKSS